MTTSINLSFDKGSLISVYIEGEIQSVITKSNVVGEVSETTAEIVIAQAAVDPSVNPWTVKLSCKETYNPVP